MGWRTLLRHDHKLSFYFFVVFALCGLVITYGGKFNVFVFDKIAERQEKKFAMYLSLEGQEIITRTQKLSERKELQEAIESGDTKKLKSLLDDFRSETGFTAFTAVNANGTALSRSPAGANIGDNVFLTVRVGQKISTGLTGAFIGAGRNFPLTYGTGFFVKKGTTTVGALMGGVWLDNAYAQKFKQKYLQGSLVDREVVFYSKMEGITGSSIDNVEIRQKMRAYLVHASSIIDSKRSGDLLNIDGKDYIITNYLFPDDANDIYGGALILTPLPGVLFVRSFVTALIIALMCLLFLLGIERVTLRNLLFGRRKTLYTVLLCFSVIIFVVVWFGLYTRGRLLTQYLNKPEFVIYNSTFKIKPASGVYVVGYPQQFSIILYSGGENVNAAEARISFDPHLATVDKISFSRSVCDSNKIISQEIDNESGTIDIACVIAEPVFQDPRAVVADIIFTPKSMGAVDFSFDDSSQVLAADGLGTNVLRKTDAAAFRIFGEQDFSSQFSSSTLVVPYSSTHDDSAVWYNNRHISMQWLPIKGAEYVYQFSDSLSSDFTYYKTTSFSNVTVEAPHDGTFYFKVAARQGAVTGPISVFKINIDTTPPENPTIKLSSSIVKKDDIVRFELSSEDDLSGLQKNFYVRSEGVTWIPTFSKIYMPFHDVGPHTVDVRVFDNAENYADSSVTIDVKE